jgi:nucleoside-diphosphate-sugar epimerase
MKVYVTGASGFIGRHLIKYLEQYDDVIVCKAEADVTDSFEVKSEIEKIKPDKVVHLAAVVSSTWADEADWYCFDVNVKGTYNVAKYAKEVGADFVYASSTSIYKPDEGMISETSPIKPTTVYNLTKWMGEEVVNNLFGDNALILRFCHVYGPDGDHCSIPLKIVYGALMRYPVIILASPKSVRSYLYIDDLIEFLYEILKLNLKGVYNIASDEYLPLQTIINITLKKLEEKGLPKPKIVWRPETDYMGSHKITFNVISSVTGWKPKTSFERGIEKCIESLIR